LTTVTSPVRSSPGFRFAAVRIACPSRELAWASGAVAFVRTARGMRAPSSPGSSIAAAAAAISAAATSSRSDRLAANRFTR
jgi:hypothetical protein